MLGCNWNGHKDQLVKFSKGWKSHQAENVYVSDPTKQGKTK